jgi:uncharacterized protein (DUF58 family)
MSARVEPLALGPLLDALRGVKWPARERVRAGLPGTHRAAQRGTTGEFTEFRSYRQGDDPRRIDWRLLARSDRAYVRITDERAWWPTWILVDASASMAFPSSHDTRSRGANAMAANAVASNTVAGTAVDKWTMARALATGLAAVAHATGDPVGLWVASRPDGRRLPPRTRRGTVHAIANALDAVVPSDDAPLAPMLMRVPVGVRAVLITDALGDADAMLSAIARAGAAGSDVTVVHVVHPLEVEPPAGAWRMIDPESSQMQRAFGASARDEYTLSFASWRIEFARRCLAAGARHLEVMCNEQPARAVRRIAGAAVVSGA